MTLKGVSGKVWRLKSDLDWDRESDREKILAAVLANRGITSPAERDFFLKPKKPAELTPADFDIKEKDLKETILKLKEIKESNLKIIIYGDYDADGVCAAAILWEALYSRGFDALPYLPDRSEEGYGIQAESVAKLKAKYPDLGLVITVDNGIVAFKDVEEIRKMGIGVVITDHHQRERKLPSAEAIVYSNKVAGTGVSWFLAREIRKSFPVTNSFYDNDGLELAVIGTVADKMSLVGVNRSLAKYGLKALNQTKRKGLLSLWQEAGIRSGQIGVYELDYIISPRINAMGRISHAMESLRLLCTKDINKARQLAAHLNRVNQERQKMVDELFLNAKEKARKQVRKNKILVVTGRNYHEGIIGLVASKLVEEFYRPAIVISEKGSMAKGSARSVAGFNIIESLRSGAHFFESLGGHPMAAGFSLKTKMLDDFKTFFWRKTNLEIKDSWLVPKLSVDFKLDLGLVDEDFASLLKKLEPTGIGNPTPLFLTRKVQVRNLKQLGNNGKHWRLVLEQGGRVVEAIAFGFGDLFLTVKTGDLLDIVYQVEENSWRGVSSVQLKLKDFRIAD